MLCASFWTKPSPVRKVTNVGDEGIQAHCTSGAVYSQKRRRLPTSSSPENWNKRIALGFRLVSLNAGGKSVYSFQWLFKHRCARTFVTTFHHILFNPRYRGPSRGYATSSRRKCCLTTPPLSPSWLALPLRKCPCLPPVWTHRCERPHQPWILRCECQIRPSNLR